MLQKIVAGGPGRKTRFHTEQNALIPLSQFARVPETTIYFLQSRLLGRRPELPWWPFPAIERAERALQQDRSRVIEFGSGSSTLWLARRARSVASVEDNPVWHKKTEERLAQANLENAEVKLRMEEKYYDLSWLGGDSARFDFAVIDGNFRWKTIESVLPRMSDTGVIYLDNSDSDKDKRLYADPAETRVAQAMLRDIADTRPGASLVEVSGMINGELHAGSGMFLYLG